MKKKFFKILILFLFISLTCLNIYSQQNTFTVITFYGKVDYRTSATQSWKKFQTGESLKKDYEIKLDKNSYAALMYNDGRTLEVGDEGIFLIKELEQNVKNSKTSVTQKFANFVAQEIITDKSEKKNMKTFAAVVRVKPNHIEAAIPSFTSSLEPVIELAWYNYPLTEKYIMGILSTDNSTIFMDLVGDTTYTLDTESLKLGKDKTYKWYVFDANDPKIVSDTNSVSVVSNANKSLILDTLQLLNDEIGANETPLNSLSLAEFYIRNNLNIEALIQFNRVVLLAPESEEYKKLFVKFLMNNKLYVRASELLEEKINEQ